MLNRFGQGHGSCVRVACQIIHIHRGAGGRLVDLITLEPASWNGEHIAPGTPFTLGFNAHDSQPLDELDGMMGRSEQACAVLNVGIRDGPDGLRYEFGFGLHRLVVMVDTEQER